MKAETMTLNLVDKTGDAFESVKWPSAVWGGMVRLANKRGLSMSAYLDRLLRDEVAFSYCRGYPSAGTARRAAAEANKVVDSNTIRFVIGRQEEMRGFPYIVKPESIADIEGLKAVRKALRARKEVRA